PARHAGRAGHARHPPKLGHGRNERPQREREREWNSPAEPHGTIFPLVVPWPPIRPLVDPMANNTSLVNPAITRPGTPTGAHFRQGTPSIRPFSEQDGTGARRRRGRPIIATSQIRLPISSVLVWDALTCLRTSGRTPQVCACCSRPLTISVSEPRNA